jgi:phage terminase large subunit-like protein
VWLSSNAGHADSVLLLQLRQAALAAIATGRPTSSAYLEWSAREDAAVDDEKAWAQANPALGQLVDLDTIRALRASTPEPVFRTEQLCQFVDTMDAWLPAGAWDACQSDTGLPDDVAGRVVFGVDRSPSWDSCSIVAAVQTGKRVAVEVVRHWDAGVTPDQLADELQRLAEKWSPKAIAGEELLLKDVLDRLDEHGHGRQLHRVRGAAVARACSTLYRLVVDKSLAHNGDPLLADHVRASARRELGDTWRLSRRHSARHIDAAMALAFAVHADQVAEESDVYIPRRAG